MSVQSEKISPEIIRQSLLQVQASTLHDKRSGKTYLLPSKISNIAKEIYRVMGTKLPRSLIEIKCDA